MAEYKRHLLVLALLGTLFLITFISSDQWGMSKDKTAERIQQLQDGRKQLLNEFCNGDKEGFSVRKKSLEDLSEGELRYFMADDTHGIIYCYVPKVACTSLKRVMYVLNQNKPNIDPASISTDFIHSKTLVNLLDKLPAIERKAKLKHYTKFLFVRDPFIRLFSAYRDKFMKHNSYYYQTYARSILQLYGNMSDPPKTADEAFVLGVRPSFYNFVQYLLDQDKKNPLNFDEHWMQIHRLCHPCLINYDFIGHHETLQDDSDWLLKSVNLEGEIMIPPSNDNMTSHAFLKDMFRDVPLEDRRKLYKIYELDFRMFGYRKPVELLDD